MKIWSPQMFDQTISKCNYLIIDSYFKLAFDHYNNPFIYIYTTRYNNQPVNKTKKWDIKKHYINGQRWSSVVYNYTYT